MQSKINLPLNDDDLLKECKIEAYRASGSGGQHINVTDSAVRLTHLPSGMIVTSQKSAASTSIKNCLKNCAIGSKS